MHHYLSKPDYLEEVNQELHKRGQVRRFFTFDDHFVLMEEDWSNGVAPEDVARRIHEGVHRVPRSDVFYPDAQ